MSHTRDPKWMKVTEGKTMSQHTKEPWKGSKTYPKVVRADDGMPGTPIADCYNVPHAEADASRIIDCVNGCAGLKPAAYRVYVEALTRLLHHEPSAFPTAAKEQDVRFAKEALTQATQEA